MRVHKIAKSDCYLHVRPSAWNNSAPTGRIFMKFYIWVFFENLSRNFKFHYNLTIITGTLHEDRYTFFIISRSVLLRMRNVSDKSCRRNQNTHFVFSNFFSKNRAVCEIMWKNTVKRGRPQMTIWRMRIACYKHTLTICNTYCFSTTTVVARTRLNVTLYLTSTVLF